MSQDLKESLWFTARVRMRTERRLRFTSRILNALAIWYSTVLTCLTVYQLIAEKDESRDITSAALAIVLLAFSTFIPSLNLDQQADRFRECYLKLQRLSASVSDPAALTAAYHDILDAYPNHPSSDYMDMIVASKFTHQKLTSGQNPLQPTFYMCAGFIIRKVAAAAITAAAVLAPGLLYFIL